MTSDARTHGLVLQMDAGLLRETFHIVVILTCFPNPDTIIGDHTITLTRGADSGSGSSTGGGGSGAGTGTGTGGGGGSTATGSGGTGPSSAGRHCVVPKLAGKTLTAAKRLLVKAHCRLGTVTAPKVKRGVRLVVRRSAPSARTIRPRGTKVALYMRRAPLT